MVNKITYSKRGWVKILEATIAVMIVSGVMIAVYSQQQKRGPSANEYFYNLQRQILSEIASRNDLRLEVLNTVVNDVSDTNFSSVNNFVSGKIPPAFEYFLRICKLGDNEDFCKMDTATYIKTQNKNIYVEETIIASDLGNTTIEKIYNPKKVRLFVWRK